MKIGDFHKGVSVFGVSVFRFRGLVRFGKHGGLL